MEYRERSRTERIQQHLEAALQETENSEKNRHIRESLQLLEPLEPDSD